LNQNAVRLRAIKNVNQDFIFYRLKCEDFREYIVTGAQGSANQAAITLNNIFSFQLQLPKLPTQIRIASILSSLDDKIELNRRMNKTLEQMAQASFYKYCLQGEIVSLGDLIEFNPKLSFRKGQFGTYIEMGDLPEQGLSINNSILRQFNGGSKFQNGDTLFARITPCLENGKTAFVDILDKNEIGFGSTEFIVMRAKENVSSYFPYMVARDKSFREYAIKSMVGTSGRQRVQTEMLLSFEVPKCNSEQMSAFHEFSKPMFSKIKSNTKEIKTLSIIRDTLLPKLMSGQIDIEALSDEAIIAEEYTTTA
jgi:type I restriction enzyme S subunit